VALCHTRAHQHIQANPAQAQARHCWQHKGKVWQGLVIS
jgi:hypothetical protein